MLVLADQRIWDGQSADFHILGWKSVQITRTCRSTMQAETQSSIHGIEAAIRIRAALADTRGQQTKDWERSSASCCKLVALTDCDSLNKYIKNPAPAGVDDKRLEVDLESMRQHFWEDFDGNPKDEIDENPHIRLYWIDTSTMIADPLTKHMNSERLDQALASGYLDLEPTAESKAAKAAKSKQRSKTEEASETPGGHGEA